MRKAGCGKCPHHEEVEAKVRLLVVFLVVAVVAVVTGVLQLPVYLLLLLAPVHTA